ncbi:type II secretion system protein J [Bacteroidota bacterium]
MRGIKSLKYFEKGKCAAALKNNSGFTLIEVVVSINLSFILITLMVSVYLFSLRFTTSTVKMLDEKSEMSSLFTQMFTQLQRSDSFSLTQNDTMAGLIINDTDTVKLTESYISTGYYGETHDIDRFNLIVITTENDFIEIENGLNGLTNYGMGDSLMIHSSGIKNLFISAVKNERPYELSFNNPKFGIKSFVNAGDM